MIIDALSAAETTGTDAAGRALASFISFIERRLGVKVVRDSRSLPHGDFSLYEPTRFADLLRSKGIIKRYYPAIHVADEPFVYSWAAICNNSTEHQTGGSSLTSEADALRAALAEALERYIWFLKQDYFVNPSYGTVADIARKGDFIPPDRIAGFTPEQRALSPRRAIHADSRFHWIQGTSLIRTTPIYLPTQVVSGVWSHYYTPGRTDEPLIRPPITNGLATWPTQAGARCAGANEVIEREAYITMWLNQLSLPRYTHASLRQLDPTISTLIDSCEKYRLKMHVVKMLTDAPTHAVAVVIEDMSGTAPRFIIGIRSHRSLAQAIQKAATEAFRARSGYRYWVQQGNVWDPTTPPYKVGHRDRLHYWGVPENAPRLAFLVAGDEIPAQQQPWDHDDAEQHLERIVAWCREKDFECVAVSLGHSPTNPTPLHIEMVVMPDLQWTYLTEATQAFGSNRWREIPKAFGYTPRAEPFAAEPHPFS